MMTFLRRIAESLLGTGVAADDGDTGVPLHGYHEGSVATRYVDTLSDAELSELNRILRWNCFTADGRGRRFGRRSKAGKRDKPQTVPDARIVRMDERFGLRGRTVLEFGCFEGVHTIGLAMRGAVVTAVDSRIENVVKSMVRTAFFGCQAAIFRCDVEDEADWALLPKADLVHHVGVLYHLKDPATHLLKLGALAREGIMLDTHFALPEQATQRYAAAGREFAYKTHGEGGQREVFSGMYDHAKWLTLDTLRELLVESGLRRVEIVEERAERNGPRVLLLAAR